MIKPIKKTSMSLFIFLMMLIMCVLISGCKKTYPDSRYWWTIGNVSLRSTNIIYQIESIPTKIIDDKALWDKDDIVFNIKFGWNEELLHNFSNNISDYEIKSFAMYFYP